MLSVRAFRTIIYDYYEHNKRSFAWRDIENPYYVVVSEIMLQQTQTFRVADKFDRFVQVFPDFHALAQAPFAVVLSLWKGLGYNRRALYLQYIAQRVVREHAGVLPCDLHVLQAFDGIGPATASSIITFAFNKPEVFIETNIRAVFLHHFFPKETQVHDRELLPLVKKMLDTKNPCQWYYALMDYGVMLKKEYKNPARRSKHHNVQSKFEGSDRQIRGKILEFLLKHRGLSSDDLYGFIKCDYDRLLQLANQLVAEKMIVFAYGKFFIA